MGMAELVGFAGQKNQTPLAIALTVGIAIILAFAGFMAQGVIIIIIAFIYQGILQYGRRRTRDAPSQWGTLLMLSDSFFFLSRLLVRSSMDYGLLPEGFLSR
jgi:hypothetical protein